MASSSKPKRTYDVFLSFRGTDQRNKFAGHLYQALDQNGIYTFRDNEELRKGDQIFPALMKAIEESCFAIIVFSEDYASSWWCLEEVAKIMECKKRKHVLPVFYKVDPREVRTGRENYARALAKHESKYGKDSEKVRIWKKALFDAGNLFGWHLNDEDESKLIQGIVKHISTHLDRTPLPVAKHPVGIDYQVVQLKSMLNIESNDGVLMVGLWGQGGIGKTALAKALYNAIHRQFQGSCFLAEVREASKDCKDLVSLQKKILSDILLWKRLVVSNFHEGINLVQNRLCHKKVLLILDDVDNLRQLNALAGDGNWFGNGSRIIVTTRDKHLLTCHGIDQDHIYEVRALDDRKAHELLSKHAFFTHQKLEIMTDLVKSVINYAKGLPLALEVLGAFLRGRREREWQSTLNRLSRIPNREINNVLKISYDGLEEDQKEIFLHIACFFKGWDSEYIKKVLNSCDFEAVIGLEVLFERSLISTEWGKLQMHDLIQSMGMDIVRQECRDDPKRRSRLWLYDDVVDVLSSDMEDCAVKAIVLDPPKPIEICIGPDAFTKMRRLRFLILRNVHNTSQGPICLLNELRWFEWPGCACQIPEFSSGPKKLVGLDMSKSSVTIVPNQFKDFQQMKYINFSECELLYSMPDLSCTPKLQELYLRDCQNLEEAHESIAYHNKLQVLNLSGCENFKRFPNIPHKLESLKFLFLKGTAIKELPAAIENLVSLKSMDLCNCKNLISLPSTIYKLQNIEELILQDCTTLIGFPNYEDPDDPSMKTGLPSLQYLNLQGCNLLEVEFLDNLSSFPSLRRLNLSRNNITGLPTSINKRDHLSLLNVGDCYQLQEIPKLPPYLNYFWADNCKSLQKTGDLISSDEIARKALSMIQKFTIDCYSFICLPGGEMPEWFVPVEEGLASFRASKDLYDKFLGLAFCVVLSNSEQKEQQSCFIKPYVNGQRRRDIEWTLNSFDSDHLWFQFHTPYLLFRAIDFGPIDGSYEQFGLEVSCEKLKKWGFRIICKQLEDNLKVMLQDNQLMNPALLHEVGHDSTDSETESSRMHKDTSREIDCHTEEHNHIGSKRNHEFILPQGKRVKTVLTSNSTDGEENGEEAIRRQTSNSTNATFSITTAHLPSDTSEAPTNVRSPPANGGDKR